MPVDVAAGGIRTGVLTKVTTSYNLIQFGTRGHNDDTGQNTMCSGKVKCRLGHDGLQRTNLVWQDYHIMGN